MKREKLTITSLKRIYTRKFNDGARWSEDDEVELLNLWYGEDNDLLRIALATGRSGTAVLDRLNKLKIISFDQHMLQWFHWRGGDHYMSFHEVKKVDHFMSQNPSKNLIQSLESLVNN